MDELALPPGAQALLTTLGLAVSALLGHLVAWRQASASLQQARTAQHKVMDEATQTARTIYEGIIATQRTDNDGLRERVAGQDARIADQGARLDLMAQTLRQAERQAARAEASAQDCLEREAGYVREIATLKAAIRGLGGTL
jgi:hypothetical protein